MLSKKHKIFQLLQGPIVVVILGIVMNYCYQQGILNFTLEADQLVRLPVPDSFAGFLSQFTFPDFTAFSNPAVYQVAFVLAIVVLGGMGSQFAVILAAILLVVSRELMRDLNEYSMLVLGGLMVLMMIWRPQGLLPMKRPHLKLRTGKKGEQA